ncbi:hypothetical protein NDU88_005514 [Pleurodeles waltl]|uniref:Uncharacterized protein n=1 Tax=Pleurodeles waltl TaxID=8319 RepID=A0AAV7PG59_PLEWA|nr:hypothetical protein NDU88_005514 [Pleurodeles waltl]
MEKCPGGAVESISFIRQDVGKKQEEEARRVGRKEGGEDADQQADESMHRSRKEEILDCEEAAGRQQTA